MRNYGKAAVRAVHLFTGEHVESPGEAWVRAAAEIFGAGTSSTKKGCPQNAFLGLCEEGLVNGIPAGQYTRSLKNKQYALNAIAFLQRNPRITVAPNDLWHNIQGGKVISHNSQMDVVVALWENGLIVKDV